MIPHRRKRERSNIREPEQIRCPGHLAWLRGFECSAAGSPANLECYGKTEAAHVRGGTDGGLGIKPSDNFALPLCALHHRIQHQVGEAEFQRMCQINMRKIADDLWKRSPHRLKLERKA